METFSQFLGQIIPNIGWVLAGAFALLGMFNSKQRERRRDDDITAANLINTLKTTVDIQEKAIAKMRTDMEEHTRQRDVEIKELRDKVHNLSGRNGVLEDLFKGRDPGMQNFLKEAPMLMDIARENNGLAKETSKALVNLTNTIEHLVSRLPVNEQQHEA